MAYHVNSKKAHRLGRALMERVCSICLGLGEVVLQQVNGRLVVAMGGHNIGFAAGAAVALRNRRA